MSRDGELFSRNMNLLRQRWPGVAAQVEGAEPLGEDALVASRSGTPTLRLVGDDGSSVWIHSRYRPEREAESQVDRLAFEAADTIFVFGLGLGYALARLVEKAYPTNMIVVIERDPAVLRAALESVCFESFLTNGSSRLFVDEEPESIFAQLEKDVSRVFSGSIKLFPLPTVLRSQPAYYERALEGVKDFMRHGTVMIRSALYLSRISLRNRLRNVIEYVSGVDLRRLKGRYRGFPGILVGAGPSLDKNVDLLERAHGRAVIGAVSTSLKLLLGRGIRPHFTNIIDYHAISKRYFDGIPQEDAVPIICDLKANTEAVASYPGPRVFANDHLINSLLDGVPGDKGDLTSGATVAHAAFNILEYLGCDPIILVGMDLSYPNGRHHVGRTAIQDQAFAETNRFYSFEMKEWEWYLCHRKQLVEVPGIDQESVWTSDVFFSYLREFEGIFEKSKVRVIDATEGGARKRGAEVMALADALDACTGEHMPAGLESLVPPGEIEESDADARVSSVLGVLDDRIRDAAELERVYKQCCRLLERVVDKTAGGEAADEEVVKVIEKKADLKKFGFLYFLLNNLAQADLRLRIARDLGIEGEEVSGVEKQHRQAERDLGYVKGLRRALEFVVEHLREARDRARESRRTESAEAV